MQILMGKQGLIYDLMGKQGFSIGEKIVFPCRAAWMGVPLT
jgi:hypothetical protein